MLAIVTVLSGERAKVVLEEMPLKVVFAFEHFYFLQNGFSCTVLSFEESLEDLMRDI
jgi:hypothetical protein